MFELKIDSTLPLNQILFICFCALQRSKEPKSDILVAEGSFVVEGQPHTGLGMRLVQY